MRDSVEATRGGDCSKGAEWRPMARHSPTGLASGMGGHPWPPERYAQGAFAAMKQVKNPFALQVSQQGVSVAMHS
jgi:hypothetical protein